MLTLDEKVQEFDRWIQDSVKIRRREALREEKKQRKLRFFAESVEKAKKGDVDAILAVGWCRSVILSAVQGRRSTGVTQITSSRKAIAEAKKRIAAREQRRFDFTVWKCHANQPPNMYRLKYISKLKARAIAVAERYHRTVQSLYRSKRAEISYGRGGSEDSSRPYRGSFKGWTARWKNAGARLDDEKMPTCFIIENSSGKEVARIPIKGES